MELKITKEKVLEAASKCSTAKATLETLFPEVFESEIFIGGTTQDLYKQKVVIELLMAYGLNPANNWTDPTKTAPNRDSIGIGNNWNGYKQGISFATTNASDAYNISELKGLSIFLSKISELLND